jgi:polynucleotide 5'-kinase involved in rRNA processing
LVRLRHGLGSPQVRDASLTLSWVSRRRSWPVLAKGWSMTSASWPRIGLEKKQKSKDLRAIVCETLNSGKGYFTDYLINQGLFTKSTARSQERPRSV